MELHEHFEDESDAKALSFSHEDMQASFHILMPSSNNAEVGVL